MLSVPRAPDAHRLLLRALTAAFPDAAVLASHATPWASATFTGSRHEVALRFIDAAGADAAAAILPDMEFTMRRHLVADVTVARTDARLDIGMLTIEDH